MGEGETLRGKGALYVCKTESKPVLVETRVRLAADMAGKVVWVEVVRRPVG